MPFDRSMVSTVLTTAKMNYMYDYRTELCQINHQRGSHVANGIGVWYVCSRLNNYSTVYMIISVITSYIHTLPLTTTGASAVKESFEEFGLSMTWTLNLKGSWLRSTLLKVFVVLIIPDVSSILKKLLFGTIWYTNWPYLPLSASSACKY